MRKIEVVEYDPSWPELFEAERRLLNRTLGDVAVEIHHVGSTAVTGLAAKPTIDIVVEVTDVEAIDELNVEMVAIRYKPKGEFGIPGRRYFQKGAKNPTHHIHAFARGDFNVTRHVAFRDYLRSNSEVAAEYGELKKSVAAACANDIVRYCAGKAAYVKRVEAIAVQEMALNQALQGTPQTAPLSSTLGRV